MMKKITRIVLLSFIFNFLECSTRKDPVIVAHRGASGYLPEHTNTAKVAAFLMEADYLEQDLVLTRDNIPLVLHDIHLDEVTNVREKYPDRNRSDSRYYVIDFDLEEIKGLKVSERFNYLTPNKTVYPNRFPMWKSDFRLNSLQEEIELIQGLQASFDSIYKLDGSGMLAQRKKRVGIYPDIKDPQFHKDNNKANFSEIVLDILKQYGYTKKNDTAIIQCFDPIELRRIRNELKSELTLVQLLESGQVMNGTDWTSKEGLNEIKKFADGIGPEKSQLIDYDRNTKKVTPSVFFNEARALGLFMHPYTFRIDSLPEYSTSYNELLKIFLDDLKIEGLFTDFTDLTLQYIRNAASVKILDLNIFLLSGLFLLLNIFGN